MVEAHEALGDAAADVGDCVPAGFGDFVPAGFGVVPPSTKAVVDLCPPWGG